MNSVVIGLCGLCGKKSSGDGGGDGNGIEMKGKSKKSKEYRYSFYLPPDMTMTMTDDEMVIDDSCGNPLFVKMGDDGNPVVRDLGGNVLDVEMDSNRLVAVYSAAPPSNTRM